MDGRWGQGDGSGARAMASLIKITKKCVKTALKDPTVTEETLHTYFVEIQSIANSRPLTPVTNNPNDIESLTWKMKSNTSYDGHILEKTD